MKKFKLKNRHKRTNSNEIPRLSPPRKPSSNKPSPASIAKRQSHSPVTRASPNQKGPIVYKKSAVPYRRPYLQSRSLRKSSSKKTENSLNSSQETTLKKRNSTEVLLRTNIDKQMGIQTCPEDRSSITAIITQAFLMKNLPPTTTIDFYRFGKQLGKGAFGKVYLGLHKLTGLKVAIKSIDKSYIVDEHSRKKVFQEVFVMNRITHPNVVKILEVFETSRHLMIAIEYVGGGDLLQLVKRRVRIPESEAKLLFQQVIDSVAACHSKNVAHRDIKLDNILLSSDMKTAKLCDFGVSRMVKPGERVNEQCGTPAYLAPEIIVDRGYEPFYVDIWSMGILLFAIVCGTVPFKAKTLPELHKLILKGKFEFPSYLSEQVQDLISKMLNPVPHLRISLEDIKEHPWFTRQFESTTENFAVPRFLGGGTEVSKKTQKELLKTLEEFGFPQEFVIQSLRFRDLNHATATYHLLEV